MAEEKSWWEKATGALEEKTGIRIPDGADVVKTIGDGIHAAGRQAEDLKDSALAKARAVCQATGTANEDGTCKTPVVTPNHPKPTRVERQD